MVGVVAKYQRYAEYKDSEVEWLEEIPSHWNIVKLSYKLKLLSGDGITAFEIEGIGSFPVYGGNGLRGYTETYNCDGQHVLIGRQGALCGNINIAQGQFFATEHAVVVYPYQPFNLTYLSEFLRFMDLGQYSVSAAQPGIAVDRINNLPILIPTFEEQNLIGNFLDHETAKIDSLIEKQQQLIQLLKEKRQVVISHAVTKGLDPSVKMKDSGVEWLGEVPEHWVTSKLKYYTNQIVDGAHFTPTYTESGIPFLRVTDIHNDVIDIDNIKYIPEVEHKELIKRCLPKRGDLLLSKNGTIGIPKLVNWDWGFSIFVSLCLIKFKNNLMAEFAEYFFKSYEIQEQIFGLIKKSTVINLHLDKIQNFWFSIPSINEQAEIISFLNDKTNELDNLISKAESAIQLMHERRTALISAAVTGKIDVRNWKNPTEAKMECSA